MVHCRTAALGGHLNRCDACDYTRPAYLPLGCTETSAVNWPPLLTARLSSLYAVLEVGAIAVLPVCGLPQLGKASWPGQVLLDLGHQPIGHTGDRPGPILAKARVARSQSLESPSGIKANE